MIIGDIADGVVRGVEGATDRFNATFFEPTIRLGVTGLSRAGKTVFITSLVANLLHRGRMPGLKAASQGRILAAYLQPQPDDTVPRFEFEEHYSQITSDKPRWPNSTRSVSQLRLSLRVKPGGLLAGLQSPRTIHLDIVDYPGEWLLDLELLDLDFQAWCNRVLDRLRNRTQAKAYLQRLDSLDGNSKFSEETAQALAKEFTAYLHQAREDGFCDCTPGRFLLPGELAGSPALTFAPINPPDRAGRGSLFREMQRRYEAYKRKVVRPFFRDHFARIDRQIVLIDVLGALQHGPQATEDLRRAMRDVLAAFRPGRNGFLSRLLRGRRVDRILFAATKADHLHQSQHAALAAITEALVQKAKSGADFAGAQTGAMALAALRSTVEEQRDHNGTQLDLVRGSLPDGKEAAFFPGKLPTDPNKILNPARDGASDWLDTDFQAVEFAPPTVELAPGEGPPHIRLDRAVEFLIGDKL